MKRARVRGRERGALQEIPIAVAVVLIGVAIAMDHVGTTGKKLLVGVDALALLVLFYYFIVAPGWRPGKALPLSRAMCWTLFSLLAAALIGGVVGFALVYP